MKNNNKQDLLIEEYDEQLSYQIKKSNLNISFNRIAFIFFVFVIVSIIFSTKAIFLGSLNSILFFYGKINFKLSNNFFLSITKLGFMPTL